MNTGTLGRAKVQTFEEEMVDDGLELGVQRQWLIGECTAMSAACQLAISTVGVDYDPAALFILASTYPIDRRFGSSPR